MNMESAKTHEDTALTVGAKNVEAAEVHALLAIAAAIERLARAIENSNRPSQRG